MNNSFINQTQRRPRRRNERTTTMTCKMTLRKSRLLMASLFLTAAIFANGQAVQVPGFRPSTSGLHFLNYFQIPNLTINVAGLNVNFGGTPYGLCGGMAFAV